MARLVTFAGPDGPRPGVWIGEEIIDLRAARGRIEGADSLPGSTAEILAGGEEVIDRLDTVADRAQGRLHDTECTAEPDPLVLPFDAVSLLAPLPDPGLIVSCGHTYARHVAEMGADAPSHPAGFIKCSSSVTGPRAPIVLPRAHPDMVDFEGEFSVVIGRPCHDVPVKNAMDHVAGYTIINDVSARDWVAEAKATGDMFFNTLGKQFPTFCPMGPCVVTAGEIADPHALDITTTVNGEVFQAANTRELVFSISELVAFWSRFYAFRPGDIITTGSPAGVGAARTPPVFLKPGDRVDIEVSGIGVLSNPVSAPERSQHDRAE